jgi:hypothetical protein
MVVLDRMPRVLFVIHTSTAFVEPFRLARLLAKDGIEPIFAFAYEHWTAEAFAKDCAAAGIQVCRAPIPETRTLTSALRYCARLARRLWRSVATDFVFESLDLRASLARARAIFETVRPDLLALSIDLADYDTGAYTRVARERGCRAMVVLSTMSNGLEQAEIYYNDPHYHVRGLARRLVARRFPKWVKTHRGRPIFRVPAGRVLAMELLGLAPPTPWLVYGSRADVITMDSDAMVDYYGDVGMPREQMVVTGSTSNDVMAEVCAQRCKRRRALCELLGFAAERPIILTALPPDFLYLTGGRPECDFSDYEALVEFWLEACTSVEGHSVVIALHPSVPASEAPRFERYGARVAKFNTAELVPLCDIYVASVSSTIRWAIACGKPVVNYDVYRYRYTDFARVEGVLACEEQQEFMALLRRLGSDRAFADQVRRKQAAVAAHWGRLDGRSGERMVALVRRLLPAEYAGERRVVRSDS